MGRMRLAGMRALVTGASSGIGLELARALAREGAGLVLVARRRDRLEALAAELRERHGVEVAVEALDLEQPDAPQLLFERTEGAGRQVDILVNNAGFGDYQEFVASPWERYGSMLQVNVVALTRLTHLFVPAMKARGAGHVMNVASIGGFLPCPNFAVYAATKAYVRNLTEALDFELAGSGVRAIAVCPGGTATEFLEQAGQQVRAGASPFLMSARRCARIAVRGLLKGRRTVVTGVFNALMMTLLDLLPRRLHPWLAANAMAAGVQGTH